MKVIEALNRAETTLSFEFYPPKTPADEAKLFEVIVQLKKFNPDYVSVTYGALGTTQRKTFYWVKEIKERFGIESVAHLTCVAASKDETRRQVEELDKMGIENILALRGDFPTGNDKFQMTNDKFRFAADLVRFIKECKPNFCLGVAGYPEKHPEAKSFEEDIQHLREKVDAGADYIVTQLFFDNKFYFDFVERCRKAGIKVPIIPGIMPVASAKHIKKIIEMCGATVPPNLELGVESTIAQCRELLAAKVKGLHFFVLNRAEPISTILNELKI